MTRISNTARCATTLVLLGLSGGLSVLGCGAPSGTTRGEATETIGSVALELEAGGLTFDSVSYAITGQGGYTKSGSIDVTNSTQIAAVIGGIPLGTDYAITLTAMDAGHSGVTCTGSTMFDVIAHATTSAEVHLLCRVPPTTGSVMVNGSINVCPTIDTFDITPSETTVGHAVTLTAAASDLDHGPDPVAYYWATSSGVLTTPGNATATLTCTTPGPVTVTVVATDGDYLCATTASQVMTCSPDAVDGGPDGSDGSSEMTGLCGDGVIDIGEACDDGNVVSGDGCSATCQLEDNPSTPGDDRAGYLLCAIITNFETGTVTCGPGFGCCFDDIGCAVTNQQCSSPFGFQSCDGPEDCPAGMQCWSEGHDGIGCAVSTPDLEVFCHSNADCIKGDTTNPCIRGGCLGDPVAQGI